MDVRKGFLALLLVPLVLLSGCNNTNTSKQPMSSFKCSLPSRPGVIQANVTDFPTELIVSSSQNTPVTFTVMFTNTMTDANYGKSEVKVEYSFIPNVGEIYTGSIDLPLAQYIQAEDKLIPMSDQDVINTEIPKEISGIGVYSGTLKWEFDAKTQADIPICIGYDPTITHVAPENLVCDPRDLPKPCYSASPVIAKVEKVTCVGSPKAGASHKGKCIITLKVVDEYGGLGECFQSNYNYLPNVTVDKIELIVDGASFQDNDGTGVLKCSGYSKNIIILYKPQFEVGQNTKRNSAGVVQDEQAIQNARDLFIQKTKALKWNLIYNNKSKLAGKNGNVEELFYFTIK